MEYSVFDSVVMESTEYAMEAVSLKDGWKKFIAFCKKIIEKCKDFLRKIVQKIRGTKGPATIKDGRLTGPMEAYDASDVETFLKEYQRPLVKFYDECYEKRTKALDAVLEYLSNATRVIFSGMVKVNISSSNDAAESVIKELSNINDNSEKLLNIYSDLYEELKGVVSKNKDTVMAQKQALPLKTYKKGTKSHVLCTREQLQDYINSSVAHGLTPTSTNLSLAVRRIEMQLKRMEQLVNVSVFNSASSDNESKNNKTLRDTGKDLDEMSGIDSNNSDDVNSEISAELKSRMTSEINRTKTLFAKLYSNVNSMVTELAIQLKVSDK